MGRVSIVWNLYSESGEEEVAFRCDLERRDLPMRWRAAISRLPCSVKSSRTRGRLRSMVVLVLVLLVLLEETPVAMSLITMSFLDACLVFDVNNFGFVFCK